MGRLFWKFFIFIWLAQLTAVLVTGALFWLDRQQHEARFGPGSVAGYYRPPPPPEIFRPEPPPDAPHEMPHDHPPPFPVKHIVGGILASLLSAAGLAWYIARPIRRLRQAFEAAASGDLNHRIGGDMGRRRDELNDLGHDFDRMSEYLQVLVEGQKRLLHDVSHELRSPLARLQAAIGLARQQPDRLDDSMQRIEREGERMNLLVGELLTLSRLEAGVGQSLETLDLGELLLGVAEDARFEGAARRVTVDVAEAPDLLVLAPPELLHRAIENVVRNALRFSPEGAVVRLEVTQPSIGRCRISISDEGPGVAENQLETIFTPFMRGEGNNEWQGEGYGLGLAIARRVISAVNGEIRTKNRPQGGLLVDIDLPVQHSPAN